MSNDDSKIELEKELNRAGISRDQRKLLNTLGFVSLEYVESLRSVAQLFGPRRNRCGIYLLWFADGFSYIGQASDVVRRFGQHRVNYSDIVAFGFRTVAPPSLDEVELRLIRQAQTGGRAGHDQVRLAAYDLGSLQQLLSDQAVLDASATLNLRLMRQRATIFSRYHNPALARLMVGGES